MTSAEEILEALFEDGTLEDPEIEGTYEYPDGSLETTIVALDRRGNPVRIIVEEVK